MNGSVILIFIYIWIIFILGFYFLCIEIFLREFQLTSAPNYISFWYRQRLNHKSLIQPLEVSPVELTRTHIIYRDIKFMYIGSRGPITL